MNPVDQAYYQEGNVFDRRPEFYTRFQQEERVNQLRRDNLELKKELTRLMQAAETPSNPANYASPIKRAHYYTTQPVNLTEAEKRILELQQIAAKQVDIIKGFDVYLQNIERNMNNIQKIDNDIYVKLSESNPNARTIQEAKEAIRRGESREYISNILARIL